MKEEKVELIETKLTKEQQFKEKIEKIQFMKACLRAKIKEIEEAEIELSKDIHLGNIFFVSHEDETGCIDKYYSYRINEISVKEAEIKLKEIYISGNYCERQDVFNYPFKSLGFTIDKIDNGDVKIVFPEK